MKKIIYIAGFILFLVLWLWPSSNENFDARSLDSVAIVMLCMFAVLLLGYIASKICNIQILDTFKIPDGLGHEDKKKIYSEISQNLKRNVKIETENGDK